MRILILLVFLNLFGCAHQSYQFDDYDRAKILTLYPASYKLNVNFQESQGQDCGPSSIKMAIDFENFNENAEIIEYTSIQNALMTESAAGTYQANLVAGARRFGYLTFPISSFQELIRAIYEGRPVIVLQNLGLDLFPKWHYSLVVGYDFLKDEMIMHTGSFENYRMDLRPFLNTWKRGGYFGTLIVRPGQLPLSSSEEAAVEATTHIERSSYGPAAQKSYEAILKKWPKSLGANLGLGQMHFLQKNYQQASHFFKEAIAINPKLSGAWYNYALTLISQKNKHKEAKLAFHQAKILAKNNPKLMQFYSRQEEALE